jgi:hypothetical protein
LSSFWSSSFDQTHQLVYGSAISRTIETVVPYQPALLRLVADGEVADGEVANGDREVRAWWSASSSKIAPTSIVSFPHLHRSCRVVYVKKSEFRTAASTDTTRCGRDNSPATSGSKDDWFQWQQRDPEPAFGASFMLQIRAALWLISGA